jgi:small subunit ribosomal protein S8
MMTDPIGDMLTRIRNAVQVKKSEIILPYSKIKFRIAEILRDNGFVESVEKIEDRFGSIRIKLKYINERSTIRMIKRVSKPGYRRYVDKDNIPLVEQGFGLAIISTPRGVITGAQAKKLRIGGEVLCFVS